MVIDRWISLVRELLDIDPAARVLSSTATTIEWECCGVTGTVDIRRPARERWASVIGRGPSAAHAVGAI